MKRGFVFFIAMRTKHKLVKVGALLLASGIVGLCVIVSPTVFGIPAVASAATGTDWMKSLNGKIPISQISIPGTHNSAALYEPIRGTAKCQNLTIAQQLDAGVRFLDIRCRHQNNAFTIYHGPIDQHQNFADVIKSATDFLRAHPSETIILSVKEEYEARNNMRSFAATVDNYIARNPSPWLLSSTVPTLNQARGKIVLLRRFNAATATGIDASNWPDNQTFVRENLRVQDIYKVTDTDDKWNSIEQLLKQTQAGVNPPLTLNFASGVKAGLFGIPNVPSVASAINPRLAQFFATNARGDFGIVVMDFTNAKLCAAIYRTNDIEQ